MQSDAVVFSFRTRSAWCLAVKPPKQNKVGIANLAGTSGKRPWRDSNSRFRLRRPTLYPLSYRGVLENSIIGSRVQEMLVAAVSLGRDEAQYSVSRERTNSVK